MRVAYFDCFSGAGGDMIVASLLDAGADAAALREGLAGLGLSGYTLAVERVNKQGLAAVRFHVALDATTHQPHRHLKHIIEIIDSAKLPDRVRDRAKRIFTRLAEAEAGIHGATVEEVHFHEVGAVDAIVDVVGAVFALELLGVERVACSPIPVGSGTISCAHGVMPVPAPATAELLKGVPIAACDETGELTTPTAAAVLTTLASEFGSMPAMTTTAIGYGAGTRDGQKRPNILRVLIGDAAPTAEADVDHV
ncbi:MAG: nickel pincer cofactor biosynthesis protein LarC, partial [Phycisphaerales bacterium]|nr:nickel pincer cofactor biosynthesis protein LarC [Phycisphaerales bacterium]